MDVTIPYRFKVLGNTAAALAADTGIPKARELVIETDTGRAKLGDGVTSYPSLDYINLGIVDFSAIADGRVPAWDAASSSFKMVAQSTGGGGGGLDASSALYTCWDFTDHGVSTSTATGTTFTLGNAFPTAYTQGSGATAALISSTGAHPGICQLSTGTTTSGYSRLFLTPGLRVSLGGGVQRFTTIFRIPTLSTSGQRFVVRLGLANIINGSGGNYVAMDYRDDLNSGNWQLFAIDGSGTTTTNSTSAPVAGTWYRLDIYVNAAGTSAEFFIDDTSIGTTAANIPTTDLGITAQITKTTGGSSMTLEVDTVEWAQTFTDAR